MTMASQNVKPHLDPSRMDSPEWPVVCQLHAMTARPRPRRRPRRKTGAVARNAQSTQAGLPDR
jgi:hypothetical protein